MDGITAREKLAALFRDAREKAGKTQDEFGFELGVSGAYISRLEAGKAIPSVTLVALFGEKSGINTSDALDALKKVKGDRIDEQIEAAKP